MTTTPTERRLAITPDPMNNPKDMLVSDERLRELRDESENMIVFGREVRAIYEAELTKLRSERDELVGALRPLVGMWVAFTEDDEDGPADISHQNAYQTFYKGMSGEWSKSRAILAKHKPE